MDTEIVCQHILLNKKLQMLFGRSSIELQRCLWFQLVSTNFVLLHPPLGVSATKSVTPITWGKLKIFKYNRSFESAKLSVTLTSKGVLLVGSTSPLAMAMASVWERFVLGIKVKTLWLLPYWEKNYVQQPTLEGNGYREMAILSSYFLDASPEDKNATTSKQRRKKRKQDNKSKGSQIDQKASNWLRT